MPRSATSATALASLASSVAAAGLGCLWPGQGQLLVALDGTAVFQVMLIGFAQFYGNERVTMWGIGQPVPARGLSYFFVGLGLASDLFQRQFPLAAGAAAALCTFLVCRGGSGLGDYFRRLWRRRRTPSGMQVLDGGRAGVRSPAGGTRGPQRWVN